jgi:hypothetical protein
MSSWTQVYISGLSKSISPSDEEIEDYLNTCYCLDGGGNDNHNDDDGSGSGEHFNSNDQDGIISSSNSSVSNNLMWAGPGSTLIKRDDNGCCRGYAFLTFYSMDGALLVIDRINNDIRSSSDASPSSSNMRLRAELSNPTSSKKKGGKKKKNDGGENLTDLRLRRQRKQPVRKHPVITSSDGKRTNLGNKTK